LFALATQKEATQWTQTGNNRTRLQFDGRAKAIKWKKVAHLSHAAHHPQTLNGGFVGTKLRRTLIFSLSLFSIADSSEQQTPLPRAITLYSSSFSLFTL